LDRTIAGMDRKLLTTLKIGTNSWLLLDGISLLDFGKTFDLIPKKKEF
jgi:hypothetical protein